MYNIYIEYLQELHLKKLKWGLLVALESEKSLENDDIYTSRQVN